MALTILRPARPGGEKFQVAARLKRWLRSPPLPRRWRLSICDENVACEHPQASLSLGRVAEPELVAQSQRALVQLAARHPADIRERARDTTRARTGLDRRAQTGEDELTTLGVRLRLG